MDPSRAAGFLSPAADGMNAPMRKMIITAGVVALLLAAGCESSSPSSAPTSTSPAAGSAAGPTSAEDVVATSAAAATTEEFETGIKLYAQACNDSLDYFRSAREMAELLGEPYDEKAAADALMKLAASGGEGFIEGGDIPAVSDAEVAANVMKWENLSSADKVQVRRGVDAAAKGHC